MVAREASRAAGAGAKPARAARCVTAAGTYTDPAQSPMIDTSRYAQLSTVRRRKAGGKRARKARPIVHRPPTSPVRPFHRLGAVYTERGKATRQAGNTATGDRRRQAPEAPV